MSISGKMKALTRLLLIAVLVALIGLGLYARLAPTDPGLWHRMPQEVAPGDRAGGAVRVVPAGEDGLARLHGIISATARTRVLAGSPEEGMVTYVTRSRVFGFPDYTTVRQRNGQIEIWGRLRFGASDLGVNAARIDHWLEAFGQGR